MWECLLLLLVLLLLLLLLMLMLLSQVGCSVCSGECRVSEDRCTVDAVGTLAWRFGSDLSNGSRR